jgi:hypothetical protein
VSVRRMGVQEQKVMPLKEALRLLADEATPPDLRRSRLEGAASGGYWVPEMRHAGSMASA